MVRAALDAGVNFIDTATAYRTEPLVAAGLRGRRREQVVLSSKRGLRADGGGDRLLTGAELEAAVEASLRRLETDYIDVYHLHGVSDEQYAHARTELVPALLRLREAGKVRFLGITERFGNDTEHRMLRAALDDGCFEVVMVGFNMLNHTARDSVLRVAAERDVGTMIMFAVRRAFSRPSACANCSPNSPSAAKWTGNSPRRGIRSASSPPRPRTSPTPPTATASTSRASAPCCPAPVTSATCAPMPPHSPAARCRPPRARKSTACSPASPRSAAANPSGGPGCAGTRTYQVT